MNSKSNTTSVQVIRGCFAALVQLEKPAFGERYPMTRDDDISLQRARNELYQILTANGYSIKWNGKLAQLRQGKDAICALAT